MNTTFESRLVGNIDISCAEPGDWTFEAEAAHAANGLEEIYYIFLHDFLNFSYYYFRFIISIVAVYGLEPPLPDPESDVLTITPHSIIHRPSQAKQDELPLCLPVF